MGYRLRVWNLVCIGPALLVSGSVLSQSTDVIEPESSDEYHVEGFASEPNQHSEFLPLLQRLESMPVFSDSQLQVKPRTYYLNRNRDENPDNLGWALGGSLAYQSGWWQERLQVAATLFTSQKLHGPSDKDGTLLFEPGPEGFTVLGEANVTLRLTDTLGLRAGRQSLDLPYLGKHDIRMVPNTFEGVVIGSAVDQGFSYIGGYITDIKRKNDDQFISMAEAAGADDDGGTALLGARYTLSDQLLVGGIYQHTDDVFDTWFFKTEQGLTLTSATSAKASLQYTNQYSVGDQAIGDFATDLWSAKLEYSIDEFTWRLGASVTDSDHPLQKPFGNPANYLSVIVDDFDRAGEQAMMFGVSMDLGQFANADLSAFGNVVRGDTPDKGVHATPDETEYDLTFDAHFLGGSAESLWIRIRAAWIDQEEGVADGDDFFDFRIIVNYDLDLI